MHYFIDKPHHFSTQLIKWYELNQRSLPWRNTQNPYQIWLSEIILQQTRVAQGMSYYLKFIVNYPTVKHLANAKEEEVLKDWQGLGYYSRARNLHKAAKYISKELNNVFPKTHSEIKKLAGVGDYTSAAIASFAYDLPYAVVDGNVYRVLSRVFGIDTPIDSTRGKKEFATLAQTLLSKEDPAENNQAIMEFGAMQCTAKNPNCKNCIFSNKCVAFLTKSIESYPCKEKKLKQKTRFLNYLLITFNDSILLNYRSDNGIWQNLYDFPLIESKTEIDEKNLKTTKEFKTLLNNTTYKIHTISKPRKHILSHQILFATFYYLKLEDITKLKSTKYEVVNLKELPQKPIPKLIENYLREETNLLPLLD